MTVSRLKRELPFQESNEHSGAQIPNYISPVKSGPQTRYGNNRWEVYSRKLNRNVTLYSNLEYDHWVLVESNPEVVTFCEQPLKIRIQLSFGVVTTIFDMWIKWKSGLEEFREVKHLGDLQDSQQNSRVLRQIQAQKKWCELKNKKHSVVTEETIRANPNYLSNWKLILHHLGGVRNLDTSPYMEKIKFMLKDKGASSLGEIENVFSDMNSLVIKSAVFELIYKGELANDLESKPLDMKSMVGVKNV